MHPDKILNNIKNYIESNCYEMAYAAIDRECIQYILKNYDSGILIDFLNTIYPQIDVDRLIAHLDLVIHGINVDELSHEFILRFNDVLNRSYEIGKSAGNDHQCIELLTLQINFNKHCKNFNTMVEGLRLIETHHVSLHTLDALLEQFDIWFEDVSEFPEEIQYHLWFFKGATHYKELHYSEAIHYYEKADACAVKLGRHEAHSTCNERMGVTYGVMGNYTMQLHYHLIAKEIRDTHSINELMGNSYVNVGLCYMNLGDQENAISYYREGIEWQLQYERIYDAFVGKLLLAYVLEHGEEKITLLKETIEYFRSIHDEHRLAESMYVLFESLAKVSLFDQAVEIYQELLGILKHKTIDLNLAMAHKTMGEILMRKDTAFHDVVQSEKLLKQSIDIFRTLGVKDSLYQALETHARLLETEQRWEEYARTFKEFHDLKHEVLSTEVQMKLHALEDQRKRDLEEHERKIQKIQIEEQEKLLHNVLPPEIAVKILAGEQNIADYAESVSVFFFDIVGFTEVSRMMSPRELLEGLNRIFTHIDALALEHSIEKIKTIGDAYLAVSGIPTPCQNHAEQIANFALAIQKQSKEWSLGAKKIAFRMGIHCGPVISGIIGSQRFAFDIWGDTVNIASRMESNGQAGKIHISEEFAESLRECKNISCIHRGKIDVKGRGFVNTYWLEQR